MTMFYQKASWAVTLVGGMLLGLPTWGGNLLQDYQKARQFDPTFSASLAEYETQRIQANIAGAAYYPQAKFNRSQLANEDRTRNTVTLTQPVLNFDRWLSLKESEPRTALAETALEKNQNDLALRLYKAISGWVDAREKLHLSQANIEALQAQTESARRAYALGLGTVTDVYDAQVRLAQARSMAINLRASLQAAERQYESMVGVRPTIGSYPMLKQPQMLKLQDLSGLIEQVQNQNINIRSSELAVQLSEIGSKRSKATFLPSLNAAVQRSTYLGKTTNSSGLSLTMDVPLDTSAYLKLQTAGLELQKAQEQARSTRQQVLLETQKVYAELEGSLTDIGIRSEAIKAAEQSLHANEQSFQGGVRSKLEVLNALQALYQTKSDYVSTLLQLGERFLNLQILGGADLDSALQQVQNQVFESPAPPTASSTP